MSHHSWLAIASCDGADGGGEVRNHVSIRPKRDFLTHTQHAYHDICAPQQVIIVGREGRNTQVRQPFIERCAVLEVSARKSLWFLRLEDGNAAVDYLIDAARTYGPDLIYVATGPLSNLALALERDAAAMMSIGRVVVMGGALTVPGNVSAGAEANMASDPEAADAVLRSGRKLTMVGLDVTHRVVLTRRDVAGWTGSGTMAGCAFASMVEHYIGSYEMNAPYLGGCALHDPLAVAVAIDPTLVGALGCNLRVDLLGEYRGRTICDEHHLSDPDKSALVALTVDAPRFLVEFKARMARILG